MSDQEPTNNQIMQAVSKLTESVDKTVRIVDETVKKVDTTMQIVSDVKTNTEQILEAIGMYSNDINERFNKVDERFNKVDERFDKVDERFDKIEANMVTKEYLDEKLGVLKGDLITTIQKSDKKFVALVNELQERKVLPKESTKSILAMEPYPLNPIAEV